MQRHTHGQTIDLSTILNASHDNKWVAIAPDYSRVIAAADTATSDLSSRRPEQRELCSCVNGSMKYKYAVVAGHTNINGRYTRRPVVEVELSKGAHRRTFLALIDSGADQILMPAYVAELFGIDRSQCPARTAMGVSMEPIDGFVGYLDFHIQHQSESFSAPVVFIDADIPVLLGREGFFDHYRIKFEQDHDAFEIAPLPTR
jgi:hypothetical protein